MSLLAVAAVSGAMVAGPPPPLEPTPSAPIVIAGEPISRGHLRHWAVIARQSPTGGSVREQVAGLLISNRWLREEARDRGVWVTSAEVERSFRKQRDTAFSNGRESRRFLRRSGQTRADLRLRIRSELLANALRELATAGAATPEAQQAALDAFAAEFRGKWRARTVCRAPWVSRSDCGTVH